jgi:hypothetical protein
MQKSVVSFKTVQKNTKLAAFTQEPDKESEEKEPE